MSDELLDALRRFADTELDQWEAFTFGSEYGPVYVTVSRQPAPDGRHYEQADDLDVTSEHFAAGRPVAELDDNDNVVLRGPDGTVERGDEPHAIERLRSTIDADPDRRAEIELEVREDDLLDLLVAAEYEARGAVLDRSDREFLARVARAAHDEIRRLRGVRPSDAELTAMRELVDLAHQALDALLSTRWRPADAPAWLWDVMGELHRIGGHGEDPHHERTHELMQEVLDAYDEQQGTAHWEAAGDDEPAKMLPTLEAVALRRVTGTDHPAAHQPQLGTAVARWYSEHHPDWRNDVDAAVDGVLGLVELIQERRQGADAQRATDRLRRAARDMATNSDEAERAGLAGDARRWWTVRGSVVAALEMLGAALPRPTVTVDVTPADVAAEEVRVHQAELHDKEPLRVGDAVWVSDGSGMTWEGTVRGRAADDPEVWRIRLWVGRHQRGGSGDA